MNIIGKREYPRFKISLDVDLASDGEDELLKATTENFSRHGIGIVLDNGRRPKNPNVDLGLYLESQEIPVLARGRITWVESRNGKNHVGIKFQGIDRGAKSDILDMAYQKWKSKI